MFPKRVTVKLHWEEQRTGASMQSPWARDRLLALAWKFAAVALLLVIALVVKLQLSSSEHSGTPAGDDQLADVRKCYKELEDLFPHQLSAIVFDQHGPHLLLAPKPDVSSEAPLYVKICGPEGCESYVTFSGQQVPVNGENCEVLSNGNGQVMLVGNHGVWTSEDTDAKVHFEARML